MHKGIEDGILSDQELDILKSMRSTLNSHPEMSIQDVTEIVCRYQNRGSLYPKAFSYKDVYQLWIQARRHRFVIYMVRRSMLRPPREE